MAVAGLTAGTSHLTAAALPFLLIVTASICHELLAKCVCRHVYCFHLWRLKYGLLKGARMGPTVWWQSAR
jgi:hypothetical protein